MTDTLSAQDERRALAGSGEIAFRAYYAETDASWQQMSRLGREQWARAEKAVIAALRAEPARAEEMREAAWTSYRETAGADSCFYGAFMAGFDAACPLPDQPEGGSDA